MIQTIINHFSNYITLNLDEINALKELMTIKKFKKGTLLLREGQISKYSFFNIKGCVRLYYEINGEEKTTFFYTENQCVTPIESYTKQIPAQFFLECVEDCIMGVISYESEKLLLNKFPKFEIVARIILEEELSNYQDILSTYIIANPEERYKNLLNLKPYLFQRIPQYQLATYLGITPESLSRIRKRIVQK